jgi:glycosyltransferase involved in cell wall biosynthesis
MENNPLISVVIPTYNRADMILRSLDSMKRQTYQNFEILIVDDASTDNTAEVIKEYNYDKIKYIRLDRNVGQSCARNIAIREASGEYIGFLDSDDEWLPNKIEKQLELFNSSNVKQLAAVYCGTVEMDAIQNKRRVHNGGNIKGNIYKNLLSGFCPASPTLFLVKKTVLLEVEGFDEHLPTFVDYDLWLRIAKLGHTFDVVDEALIIKHEHSGAQIAKDPEKRMRGLELFMEKWGAEIKSVAGEKTYNRIRKIKIQGIATSIARNPRGDYKREAKYFLKQLFIIRSRRYTVYIRLLLLATFNEKLLKAIKLV